MDINGGNERMTSVVQGNAASGLRGAGSRIAPAVALLMLGDTASATTISGDDSDTLFVPEPSVLGLLAAGVSVGGIVAYIRRKRRK
jgi:hypothetical protein